MIYENPGRFASFDSGDRLFFTSDTHFSHKAIIQYCNRPFRTVQEMDDTIVGNWNRIVPEDGIVFHLGDFAFGSQSDWRRVRERLNGTIVLIIGNHDMKMYSRQPGLFRELFAYSTQQMTIRVGGRRIILNHYPLLCFTGTFKPDKDKVWQLFGHVHSGPLNDGGLDHPRLRYAFPFQFDVGVDNNGFAPVSWKTVCDRISGNLTKHSFETAQRAVDDYLQDEALQRHHYGI